ncbi:gamma-butyrobetaine dioxygenase-like [Saccoglossus kowalevskii]|uniref:Gamma-butyrobetaine dioxygenase-like n=1 Tax=Saccoglossus kowalevskii TaxID=10224 RepID=A0ABM0GSB7_SACKO|nr:PREDICTED: gamma-butyrobetaine dioxygenase-like [Saccoglossus kowalevskii]
MAADLQPGPMIDSVEKSEPDRQLRVQWNDGSEFSYPYVWLRDNCLCPSCYHAQGKQRLLTMAELDIDVQPSTISMSTDRKGVTVDWSDGHQSTFSTDWMVQLHKSSFVDGAKEKTSRHVWGSELQGNIPTFAFEDLLKNDAILLEWLETLRDTGLVVTNKMPLCIGQVKLLGDRIGYLRQTTFGFDFPIKSRYDDNHVAYSGKALPLHTDLPHFKYTPGTLMLHCVKQCSGKGGESHFSDGFNAAYQLRDEDPEAFEVLSNTPIDFIDIGYDTFQFYTKYGRPVFSFDYKGNLERIHYNNGTRDMRLRVPQDKVYKLYKALKAYDDILNRPTNKISYRMAEGDMVTFDNLRVLHGRGEFELGVSGERHLDCGFVDWDCINSKIRVLREQLGMSFHEY